MPATRKFGITGINARQGYTDIMLKDDLEVLPTLRKVSDDGATVEFDEDVTKLRLGRACAAVMEQAESSLRELFGKLTKLLPDSVTKTVTRKAKDPITKKDVAYEDSVDELKFTMGPLKKVSRITAKAAHYAICDEKNYPKPRLEMVRDILRGTMVFPPGAWGERADKIGARMINTINDHFGGEVVQVKNRFIHGHYPNYGLLSGVKLPADLETFVAETYKQTLWGRDSFYRDLQLLIRLDNNVFHNTEALGHVMLELQLASSKMYSGKTHKDENGASGHDMYKNVRAVSEYCEFLYWSAQHEQSGGIKLPNAAGYYDTRSMKIESFIKQSDTMSAMYREKDVQGMELKLIDAIDDSDWFKANRKGT